MSEIQLATALPGAQAFKHNNNVSDTYHGQILLRGGRVVGAVLKDLPVVELANELFAALLAKRLGLPTPDVFLTLVPDQEIPVIKGPALAGGGRLVFASEDVKVPNLTFRFRDDPAILRDFLGWAGLGKLYAFDAWVANVDRHAGNLLLGGRDKVWLIDHGWCFSGPAWSPADLDPDGDYRNRLAEWATDHLDFAERRKRANEAIGLAGEAAALDIGDARRKSLIDGMLPEVQAAAVEEFLRRRSARIAAHAKRALGIEELL